MPRIAALLAGSLSTLPCSAQMGGESHWDAVIYDGACITAFWIDTVPEGWTIGDEVKDPFQHGVMAFAQRFGAASYVPEGFDPGFGMERPVTEISFGIDVLPPKMEVVSVDVADFKASRVEVGGSSSPQFYLGSDETALLLELLRRGPVDIRAVTVAGDQFEAQIATPMFQTAEAMFDACRGSPPTDDIDENPDRPRWRSVAGLGSCDMWSSVFRSPEQLSPYFYVHILRDFESLGYPPRYATAPALGRESPAIVLDMSFTELRPLSELFGTAFPSEPATRSGRFEVRSINLQGLQMQRLMDDTSDSDLTFATSVRSLDELSSLFQSNGGVRIEINAGSADQHEFVASVAEFSAAEAMFRACVAHLPQEPSGSFNFR